MKENKVMSVMKQTILITIVDGIAWCLFGIFFLFDNIPCKVLAIISILIAITSTGIATFSKHEEDDEMSIKHMHHARSRSYSIIMATVALIGIVSMIGNDITISYRLIYPFVLGIGEIIVGIYFVVYEKVGD